MNWSNVIQRAIPNYIIQLFSYYLANTVFHGTIFDGGADTAGLTGYPYHILPDSLTQCTDTDSCLRSLYRTWQNPNTTYLFVSPNEYVSHQSSLMTYETWFIINMCYTTLLSITDLCDHRQRYTKWIVLMSGLVSILSVWFPFIATYVTLHTGSLYLYMAIAISALIVSSITLHFLTRSTYMNIDSSLNDILSM